MVDAIYFVVTLCTKTTKLNIQGLCIPFDISISKNDISISKKQQILPYVVHKIGPVFIFNFAHSINSTNTNFFCFWYKISIPPCHNSSLLFHSITNISKTSRQTKNHNAYAHTTQYTLLKSMIFTKQPSKIQSLQYVYNPFRAKF